MPERLHTYEYHNIMTPRPPPAAAGQQGMAEQYHGDNGKRAPQVILCNTMYYSVQSLHNVRQAND